MLGPFRVEAVCLHSLVIVKHEVNNVLSTNRDTRAPQTERSSPVTTLSARQQDEKEHKHRLQLSQRKLNTVKVKKTINSNVTPEYTVNKFVRLVGTGDSFWYIVRR